MQYVKVFPGEFQHPFVVADRDKRKIRNVMTKTCMERRKISLLKDVRVKKRFEVKVIILVDDGAPNLWIISRMGFSRYLMRHVERSGGGEVMEIHGGGTET